MYILYYLLSVGSFVAALFGNLSIGATVFMIIMAMIFLLIGTMSALSARLESNRRPERHMISPDELRQFREQAEKNKQQRKEQNS
jgi:large-conductance mechanosensitive channel